ncbi:hypothetical protein V2G26_006475 [Clonostachys chloroleuca]
MSPIPKQAGDGSGFAVPKIRLEIRNLSDAGAASFLRAVHATDLLTSATLNVLRWLYASPSSPTTTVPPTRSVTLILRDMDGVAYTTGSDLDNDHKEVHFSTRYIAAIGPDRVAHEITGVVTHELVHCFQYDAFGTCPGREAGGKWDGGYQHTAYFLEYLEGRFGEGTVRRLNEKLRIQKYDEKTFWVELLGEHVTKLWEEYGEKLKDEKTVVVSKKDV